MHANIFSSFLVNCKKKFDRACVCPSKMKENCRRKGERPRVAGCDHWSSAKILIYNFCILLVLRVKYMALLVLSVFKPRSK